MEQFCILAGTTKGKACSALIQQVLNHKNIFTFGELLEVPSIKQLQEIEGCESAFATLQLFAYGVYRDYLSNRSKYLTLMPPQVLKLRQLTLVTLCEQNKSISYDALFHELDLSDARQLEELLIETSYLGLIHGKIDQRGALFIVTSCVSGRDVRPDEIDEMIRKLTVWRQKTLAVSAVYKKSTSELQDRKAYEAAAAVALQEEVNVVKENVKLAVIAASTESSSAGQQAKFKRTRGPGGYF